MVRNKEKEKRLSVANFNTVFLKENDEEAPLLEYFDTIIMPALNSGIERKTGDDSYLIMDVEIVEDNNGDFVLTGYIVKKTVLDRLSDLDMNGKLIKLDDHYPAAPFSTFAIYLKNHRMIFVENQKGSPRINSFRSTIKYIIDTYVRMKNQELSMSNEQLLPLPLVNVVGIPSRKSIEKELKDVQKINKLTLRFFPLNGDGDNNFSGIFSSLSKEVRATLGCRTGFVVYNSPGNKQGVIDLVSDVEGTVEPIIHITNQNGSKKTLRNDMITERIKMNINGENLREEIKNSITEGNKIDSIQYVSNDNSEIYKKNKDKIIPFVK